MCGIAAILAGTSADAPVDRDELLRMRERMTARGPDGAGLWMDEDQKVGLAHRRLAILDLSSAGAQPMRSTDGTLVLVFNGEIYNHKALRAELEAEGVSFRSHSDTEVILELYRRDGAGMLGRLRGMFAIALWDARKQGLLLARDPFGIKPLYYADDGKTVRCASQVKALLAGGKIDTSPDPAGHAGFFLWGHVPEPHTLYRAIRPLAAGSWLWAGMDGSRVKGTFFDFSQCLLPTSPDGTVTDVRAALLDSVRAHLESDVPVGVFLSSGLDSTTLAALVSEVSPQPPNTVTLGFEEFVGTANDEVPLAELVAGHYRTHHSTARVTAADFAKYGQNIVEDMDQPSVDGVNTWFVARAAKESGLKVVLSGVGGDELFGGYASFRQIPHLVRRLGPLARVQAFGKAARWVMAPWLGRLTSPKWAGVLEYGCSFGGAYLLRRSLYMPWELDQVMDADLARAGLSALDTTGRLNASIAGIQSERLKVSALESIWYMRNQLLRDSDWAGMAHSLEIRTPFVDSTLFSMIAPQIAQGIDINKRSMAAAASPPLPASILNRPKTGFFVPVAQWIGAGSLRGWAQQVHRAFQP